MAVDLRVVATLNYFMRYTLKRHTNRAQVFVALTSLKEVYL